jgi:hypothetical protein
MPRNARSTRQTEDFRGSNNVKWEGDPDETRKLTRQEGHTSKRPHIMGPQSDGHIEGQQISGDTSAVPVFPSISSGDASKCSVFQIKSADFYRGIRSVDDLNFDTTKLHLWRILQNCVSISQSPWMHWRGHSTVHDPMSTRPSRMGWMSPDNEESVSPSTKVVNNKSSTGFNRTQKKTHQSR